MKPLIREFDPGKDYPLVKGWWEAHGFPPVPAMVLPKLGVIAHTERGDQAAGWLYMDNSVGVCMLEWLVTNPANTPRESWRAIKAVVEIMTINARAMNYGVMLTAAKQASLGSALERNGFLKTDDGMSHFLKTTGLQV